MRVRLAAIGIALIIAGTILFIYLNEEVKIKLTTVGEFPVYIYQRRGDTEALSACLMMVVGGAILLALSITEKSEDLARFFRFSR